MPSSSFKSIPVALLVGVAVVLASPIVDPAGVHVSESTPSPMCPVQCNLNVAGMDLSQFQNIPVKGDMVCLSDVPNLKDLTAASCPTGFPAKKYSITLTDCQNYCATNLCGPIRSLEDPLKSLDGGLHGANAANTPAGDERGSVYGSKASAHEGVDPSIIDSLGLGGPLLNDRPSNAASVHDNNANDHAHLPIVDGNVGGSGPSGPSHSLPNIAVGGSGSSPIPNGEPSYSLPKIGAGSSSIPNGANILPNGGSGPQGSVPLGDLGLHGGVSPSTHGNGGCSCN